jgi:hypothetical protein
MPRRLTGGTLGTLTGRRRVGDLGQRGPSVSTYGRRPQIPTEQGLELASILDALATEPPA